MTEEVLQLKRLIKTVRQAVIDANNSANWRRVQELKFKKSQLKNKLNAIKRQLQSNSQGT